MRPPFGHGYEFSTSVGDEFTDGLEVLYLTGDDPAVIESVRMVGNRGFEFLGAKLVGPGREYGSIDVLFHWPPVPADFGGVEVIPARGATITPRSEDRIGWELLVGMRPLREGRLTRQGLAISYSVQGVRYRVEFPAEVIALTR